MKNPIEAKPRRAGTGRVWLTLALVASLTVAGCSVLETIDDIGKDPKAEAKAAADKAAADALPAAPDGSNQAKLRAYYNRRPKRVEEDPDDPIVSCRLSTGTQFMRKKDCTVRGGRVHG